MIRSRISSENKSDQVASRAIGCSKGKCLEPDRSLWEPLSENPRYSRGVAEEKATREGSGNSCRGDDEQPQDV